MKPKHVVPPDLAGAIVGGCPCGWWSRWNCAYLGSAGMCRAVMGERPVRTLTREDQEQ